MHLLLLLSAAAVAVAGDGSCKTIDWIKHKDVLNFLGTQLTNAMEDHQVSTMLKKFDPYSFSGDILEQLQMEIVQKYMYEFKAVVSFDHLKLGGYSTLKIVPLAAVNSNDLRFRIEFGHLDIKGRAKVKLHQLTQTGCEDTEEHHGGLCFKKCSLLTHGTHSHRTAALTCAVSGNRGCEKDRVRHQGLCYKKCKPGYRGIGPICWKGSKHHNRGAGRALYHPWTKGPACRNFGATAKGKCPYPYYRICTTERLQVKGPGQCRPADLTGDFDIRLRNLKVETTFSLGIQTCTEPVADGELLHKDIACVSRALTYIVLGALNPQAAGSMLENFNKFKSMVSSLRFKAITVAYSQSSKIDINVRGTGFVGWIVEKLHNYLKKRFNKYRTLIDDMINKQMLEKSVIPKANAIIANELRGNKCR